MQEELDTANQFDNDLPDGKRTFRTLDVEKKVLQSATIYIWHLSYAGSDGEQKTGDQVLLPSMMGPLLRVLGFKETAKDKFLWDRELAAGLTFVGVVSHEKDKKGVVRQQMKDFEKSTETADVPY